MFFFFSNQLFTPFWKLLYKSRQYGNNSPPECFFEKLKATVTVSPCSKLQKRLLKKECSNYQLPLVPAPKRDRKRTKTLKGKVSHKGKKYKGATHAVVNWNCEKMIKTPIMNSIISIFLHIQTKRCLVQIEKWKKKFEKSKWTGWFSQRI